VLAIAAAGSTAGVYLPSQSAVWPAAYASPFAGAGLHLSANLFLALTGLLCLAYALILAGGERLPLWAVLATLALCYGLLASGPPLLSRDIYGYLAYARMAALHGLNPYSRLPAEMVGDPLLPLAGWPYQHTPYGPLFTALTMPIALLPPSAAFWTIKGIVAGCAWLAVWLVARAAAARGVDGARAAVFFGANPAFLEAAVGGDHNDAIVLAAVAAGLLAALSQAPRLGRAVGWLVAATALKLSAALVPAFLLLSPRPAGSPLAPRRRAALVGWAALLLAAYVLLALILFGGGAFGFLTALGAEQRIVSPHSLPSETAIALGLAGTPTALRTAFLAAYLLALLYLAWRCARGMDWLTACGYATCGLLLASAWFLPWYAAWPLPFAALSRSRGLRLLALAISFYALTFHLPYISALLGSPGHPAP